MSEYTGLGAQIMMIEEVAYGTFLAPTRAFWMYDETLALDKKRIDMEAIGAGLRGERDDQWMVGKKQAAGDVHLPVGGKNFGVVWKHLLGGIATAADGLGKKHTATVATLKGLSSTWQAGRPSSSDGVINAMSYVGCKPTKVMLKEGLEGWLELTLSLDSQNEDDSQTLAAASVPTQELFNWNDLICTVGGVTFNVRDAEITFENKLNTDRFFQNGTGLKSEPLENGKRNYGGKLTGEFESMTAYNRFVNGTIVPIIFTWTGTTTYDAGKFYKLVVTFPNGRFDGHTPNVKGADVLDIELPFKALDHTADDLAKIEYYTSDVAP